MGLLLLLLVMFEAFGPVDAIGSWQSQSQSSKWDIRLARLNVDVQITEDSLIADTVTECAMYCSATMSAHAWSMYFVPETITCYCNSALDANPEDENVAQLYYGTLKTLHKKEVNGQDIRDVIWPPKDCLTLYQFEYIEDGVYVIIPKGGTATTTWCDMTNGGWTVFQTRKDGSENFNRGWVDYVNGFGDRAGEYWLGLENIHLLTTDASHLQVYLEAFPGVSPLSLTANYSSFTVGDGASKYITHLSGYSGDTCTDSLSWNINGKKFTTWDNDNDNGDGNCASEFSGGWWFDSCHVVMLNGVYYQEGTFGTPTHGIHWYPCWDYNVHSLKYTAMKVRRTL